MPIIYMQHLTGFQLSFDDIVADQRVLFFDPQLERSAVSVGDRFRALDAATRDVDLVVFRGANRALATELSGDPIIRAAIEKIPIAVLRGGDDPENLQPTIEFLEGCKHRSALPDTASLRQVELASIYTRTRAIFSSQSHHFALPSRYHADRFIRLGDALRDMIELRRIADWLMRFVTPNTFILGDTGSILPLITEVANRAFRMFEWQIPHDCLSEYPADRREIQQRLADLKRSLPDDARSLFVVSVNSSGQTLALVENTTRGTAQLVTVCDTSGGQTPGEVLSSLDVQRWEADASGRCAECRNTSAMAIDPQTYERVPCFDWSLVPLRHNTVQTAREFWQMADVADAVGLHVSRPYRLGDISEQRHFGVTTRRFAEGVPRYLASFRGPTSCLFRTTIQRRRRKWSPKKLVLTLA